MRTTLASILILAAAAAGCGGKSKSEMADPCKDKMMKGSGEGSDMQHMEGEEGGEPAMTPEMTSFHDVLAPLWHADASPDRQKNTCDAAGNMLDLGVKIQDAAAPEGVEEDPWMESVKTLMLAIVDLQDTCHGSGSGASFDDAFQAVHQGFHGLLDQLPHAE